MMKQLISLTAMTIALGACQSGSTEPGSGPTDAFDAIGADETVFLIGTEPFWGGKVMLINTSRGKLVDTAAVIKGLKRGKIGYLGLDVYEEEDDLFFEDLSDKVIQDDIFARLMTFPNVIVTGHQAFFTQEALHNIAQTTLHNVREFHQTGACANQISVE